MRPLARFAGSGHLPARKPRGRVLWLPRGSPIARVPLPIFCDVLPAREGSDAFPSVETPRVHHAARRRGGVAARGGRRAGWKVVTIRLLARVRRRHRANGPPPLSSDCVSWAGPRAAMSRSSIAGAGDALSALRSSKLHRTSRPPSTIRTEPVTYDASSEASQRIG